MTDNVLFVIRPVAGGMREHLALLIRYLDRAQFAPHAILPADDLLAKRLREMGVDPFIIGEVGSTAPRSVAKATLAIRRIARKTKAAVIHSHGYRTALAAGFAAKISGLPHIASVHTELRGKSSLGASGAIIQAVVSGLCSRVIVVSEAIAGSFSREKCVVIENGVELPEFESAHLAGDGRIGYIGRLTRDKGVDLLVDAVRSLIDEGRADIRLSIIGDGPSRDELEEKVKRIGLDGSIGFRGFVENAKATLTSLDVLVLPSRTEGQPMVILEAMAAGCPVIAADVGGVAGLLTDGCGILVPPNDHIAIAKALKEALSDKKMLEDIRLSARRRVEDRYSACRMAEKTMQLYREVIR